MTNSRCLVKVFTLSDANPVHFYPGYAECPFAGKWPRKPARGSPLKVLALCKRRPQGRDLVTSPYGRFFHLPKALVDRGVQFELLLADYEMADPVKSEIDGVACRSVPVVPNPLQYTNALKQRIAAFQPDWVAGFSDTYYGILAERYGRRACANIWIDAYDNYEAYIPWAKPLHWRWRRAVNNAHLATVAGGSLLQLFQHGGRKNPTAVIPMAVDPVGFEPLDRNACRAEFDLPLDRKLVGYTGGISHSRGIDQLFHAVEAARAIDDRITLVLSGRLDRSVKLPEDVIYLGFLAVDKVPRVYNALDLLFVMNLPSLFGDYSFPIKLYEAMACHIPVAAIATKSTREILAAYPNLLVEPDDHDSMVAAILAAGAPTRIEYPGLKTWDEHGQTLMSLLSETN